MIGRAFHDDRRRGAIATALALALVALQFQGALLDRTWAYRQDGTHLVVVLGVVVVLWRLAGRDFDTLGLRMRPEPSWRYWLGGAALIGLAVGVVCAGYFLATGEWDQLSLGGPDADTWLLDIPNACLFAPVFEELIYRVVLCSTLVVWLGRWPTVFVSGAIFGLLHVVNGVAGPDNVIAGYFFAWVFLRSGSIAPPIAMHAGGNLVVALLQPNV